MSGSTTAQTIQSYYQTILQRTGSVSEISYWTTLVSNGGLTLGQVESDIVGSAEAQTFVAPIVESYEVALGRVPDATGLAAWVHLAESGTSVAALEADIANSPESIALYGTTVTSASLTKLYQNAFNRAPDAAGLTAWLNSGLSMAQIEVDFQNSAEGQSDLAAASTSYLLTIGNGGTVTGNLYSSSGGIPGSTFTLTTNVDNITGTPNNDTFIAVFNGLGAAGTTLNPGDSLNGNGGNDTLKIVDTVGGNELAGVSLTNIGTVSVQNANVIAAIDNFAPFSGVSKVVALNSAGGSDTFNNLAAGAQVVVSGSATAAGSTAFFSMASAGSAVSVGVDGGVNGVFLTDTNGTETSATISSTGAANGKTSVGNSDTFVLTAAGAAASITSLTVNAATNLVATLTAGDFANTATATVSGAATSVNLGATNFKAINASALAGGLTTTTGANLVSLTGGAGNNTITLGAAPAANATITLGNGTNSLLAAPGIVLPTTAVVTGGTGTDTISASLINVGSGANVKSFSGLDVTNFATTLDASLLTNSTITALQFSGTAPSATTATIQNLGSAEAVNVVGSIVQASALVATLGSATLTQAGTSPTLAVNFSATPSSAATAPNGNYASIGNLTFTGETALSIAAGGNSNVTGDGLALASSTGNTLATVTITGATPFTLGGVSTDTGDTTSITSVASSLTTIDGSAATGALTITAGADSVTKGAQTVTYNGLTIKGGSGNDNITTFAKNGNVILGSGKATVNAMPETGAVTNDIITVTPGSGVDTLNDSLTYNQVATNTSGSTAGNLVSFNATTGDKMSFLGGIGNVAATLGTAANVSAASTFDQAVFAADAAAGGNGLADWFQYAGNTYVLDTGAAAGTADDQVVKIAGVVNLANATVTTGALGVGFITLS